jgi:drug/metabolite transporter (DMT)-like permease
MSYILFAWIASFAFGVEVLLSKLTSKYGIQNPWVFNFVWRIVLVVLMFPVALYSGLSIPSHWTNILLAAGFDALFSVIFAFCLFKLDVSTFSPLFNFTTIFSLGLGALILNEKILFWQIPLILVVVLAGFFVTYNEKFTMKAFFNKYVLLFIFGMLFLAIYRTFLNLAIEDSGFWNTTFWSLFFVPFFLLFTTPFLKKDIQKVKFLQIGSLAVVSIASVAGLVLSNIAFSQNVGIVSIIMSIPFSMILAVILAFLWPSLLEKHTKKVYAVRLISAFVMILCALKLSS